MKICSKCKIPKDVNDFYKSKVGKDGLQSRCKDCMRIADAPARAAYARRNKVKVNAIHKRWADKNPERIILIHAKTNAKRKGVPFNLTVKDISIPKYCPYLGIELKRGTSSIDEIIPGLGYIPGNIQIISEQANRMKNDATPEQLVMFAKYVLGQF